MNQLLYSPTRRLPAFARRGALLLALSGLAAGASAQTFNATTATVGTGPAGVAVGDVNNDGKLDVVTANTTANTLSVLLGTGTGTFTLQAAAPATDSGPEAVVLADVNNDGRLDALTANNGANALSVLLGNGSGNFALQTTTPLRNLSLVNHGLAVGDVNYDGKPDVLIANSSTTLGVLLGDGAGGFVVQPNSPSTGTGNTPHHPVLADVNGDGKLDVVAVNHTSGVVSVLLGNGAGGFTLQANPPTVAGAILFGVAVGDVNEDGSADLVTADNIAGKLTVLLGNNTGAFTVANTYTASSYAAGVALGDVNGDGRLDILATVAGGKLAALLNTGSGAFGAPTSLATGTATNPNALALADVNVDGKLDVLVANAGSNTLGVLLNTSASGTSIPNSTNNALALDGADDYLALPSGLNTRSFTFETWVNYQDNGYLTRMLDMGSSTNNLLVFTFQVSITGANSIGFVTLVNGVQEYVATSTVMPTGWHHLALTMAPAATGTGTVGAIYLDGAVIGTSALTFNPASLGTISNNWVGRSSFGNPYAKMALDETRFYSVALTQAQIQADRFSTTPAVPASLTAYYSFNQHTAGGTNTALSTVLDRSGRANNALLRNAALTGTTSNWARSFPTITSLAPASGAVGTNVTLTGTNLVDATSFKFNGTAVAPFTTPTTDLTTTVKVPAGTSTGPVSLTAANLALYTGPVFSLVLAARPALAAEEVTLAPNPAHGSFVVEVPAVAGASTVQAELLNVLGQVVRRQSAALPAAGATLTVPTADLAPGPYLLRLQAGATALTKRVLVY